MLSCQQRLQISL